MSKSIGWGDVLARRMGRLAGMFLVVLLFAGCNGEPCEIPGADSVAPDVGLKVSCEDKEWEVGEGSILGVVDVGREGDEYNLMAIANDDGCLGALGIHVEGGVFQEGMPSEVSRDEANAAEQLLAAGSMEAVEPGQVVRVWASAEDLHGNRSETRAVSLVIPGTFGIELATLRMLEREEASGDEPYFVLIGFRSRLNTKGSTTVFHNDYDRGWLDDADDADERDIPASMGQLSFPEIRRLVLCPGTCWGDEGVFMPLIDAELLGEMPEFFGVLMVILEWDFTPAGRIDTVVADIESSIRTVVSKLIEDDVPDILLNPRNERRRALENLGIPKTDAIPQALKEEVDEATDELKSRIHDIISDWLREVPGRDDDDPIGQESVFWSALDPSSAEVLGLPIPALHEDVCTGEHHYYGEGPNEAHYVVKIRLPCEPVEQTETPGIKWVTCDGDQKCCGPLGEGRCLPGGCVPAEANCP